jgi:hypothetical protein
MAPLYSRPSMRPFPYSASLLLVGALLACEEVPRTYSTASDGARVIFTDDFDRAMIGNDWLTTGGGVTLERGALRLADVHNHPVWLRMPLPDDVRVEFDAWAETDEGDIKVELAGDGKSFARAVNYVASGYVLIFGGWNNSQNAIVRRNEHGRDKEVVTEPKVEADRRYHFTITRIGPEIRWEVDGREILAYEDARPLQGSGQDHFAFSGWEAETRFDNLVIEAL